MNKINSLKLFPSELSIADGGRAFERFCAVAYRYAFKDPNIIFVSSDGIAEDGLDILGFRHSDQKSVGIQCKNQKTYTFSDVIKWVELVADGVFNSRINHLIIAVTKKPKVALIAEVNQLSLAREAQGLFSVTIHHFDNLRLELDAIDFTRLELAFPELFNREREIYTPNPLTLQNKKIRELFDELGKSTGAYEPSGRGPHISDFISKLCSPSPKGLIAPNGMRYSEIPSLDEFCKRILDCNEYDIPSDTHDLEFATHALANHKPSPNKNKTIASIESERRAKLHVHTPFFSYSPDDIRINSYIANFSDRFPECKRTLWIDDIALKFENFDLGNRFLAICEGNDDDGLASTGAIYARLGIYDHFLRSIFPVLVKQGIFRVQFNLYKRCTEVEAILQKYGFVEVRRGSFSSEWINDVIPSF